MKNNAFRLIFSLAVSGICLYLTFRNFTFSDLTIALQTAQWMWFLPSIIIIPLAYILRTFRWKLLMSPLGHNDFKTVFITLTFGFLVNIVLPFRIGELARAYAIKRLGTMKTSSALGTITIERIFDLMGVLFAVTIALQVVSHTRIPIGKIISLFGALGLTVIIIFILFEKKGDHFRNKLPSFLQKPFLFLHDIVRGFSSIKSKKIIFITTFLTLGIWSAEIINIVTVSRVFGLNLDFFQAAVVIVGISIGVMIPAAPGYVGTFEYFGSRALTEFMGFSLGPSTAFILILHVWFILFNVAMGIPGLIKFGLTVANPDK